MKSYIFWDITPRVVHRKSTDVSEELFHDGFLLGLFFDPEDGSDVFLRNVG
jgi:hypothetical protein